MRNAECITPTPHSAFAIPHSSDLPGLAHRTVDEQVCLIVVDEPFLLRIPLQLPTVQPERDVPEMADAHRAMTDLRVADRLLAASDALHEVLAVVARLVELDRVGRERIVEEALIARPERTAADEDPSFLAFEQRAVLTFVRRDERRAVRVGVGCLLYTSELPTILLV